MLKTKQNKQTEIVIGFVIVLTFISVALVWLTNNKHFQFPFATETISRIGKYSLIADIVNIIFLLWVYLIRHGLLKGGLKYVYLHSSIQRKIYTELYDDKVYVKRYFGSEEVAVLPLVKVTFDKDKYYMTGTVEIVNTLKDCKRLDVDISPALKTYIVEDYYISPDGNRTLYRIFNASYDRQLVFNNTQAFIDRCKLVSNYKLLIDGISGIPLHHSMICGSTGSGKSYALYVFIVQMFYKQVKYNLYFADPKSSGLAALGKHIDESRTADSIESIIELLRSFHNELGIRKKQMSKSLQNVDKIDSDYRDFGYEPYVLIFDEYLAFALSLANEEKKVRDEVTHMLSDITLMGRQCGFFLWIVMQNSNSANIPTFLRDNLVFKCVLGRADDSTYTVAFGQGAEIPPLPNKIGYGVYTYQGLTEKPRLLAFPTINDFDILDVVDNK